MNRPSQPKIPHTQPSASDLTIADGPSSLSVPSCRLDRYLFNLFVQIGIPVNKPGFRFLCDAVKLVLRDPSLQHRLMHGLYPQIALRYGKSAYCVEHSMRMAITDSWNRGRTELIEQKLGRGVITAYEKPTNGELIALVAENVRLLVREGKL